MPFKLIFFSDRLKYLLLFLVLCGPLTAQRVFLSGTQVPVVELDNLIQGKFYNPIYSNVEGSPYLKATWSFCAVDLLEQHYPEIPVLYDLFIDELVFLYRQTNSFNYIQLVKDNIKSFTLEEKTFINLRYSDYKELPLEDGYYELAFEGAQVSYLIKRRIEAQPIASLPTFVRNDQRFLIKDGQAIRVRNKGAVLRTMNKSHKKAINTFFKEKNIRLQNDLDAGWNETFEFLNTLQTDAL